MAEELTGNPARNAAMLGFRHGTAENYVFDLVAIQLGQPG
jgi:hypothetical protein